jgi:hypothetical protein
LERELVHDVKDLFFRLDDARGVEVFANFAKHIAALGIERTHSEFVRISFGVMACNSQFFGGPHSEELISANRLLPVVNDHWIFPVAGRRMYVAVPRASI